MEVERYVSDVAEEDVVLMLERLREQRKSWLESDQPAVLGDRVTIHFEGKSEGEDFTNGRVENFPLVLGSNQLIPGFEEKLVGGFVGETKNFNLAFPADYGVEKLAGKNAEFSVELVKIEKSQLPELDEEFVANFGIGHGNVDEFRSEIKTSMEREMRRALSAKSKDSVMEELYRRNASLVLPSVLINEELKSLIDSYKSEAEKRKQVFDEAVAQEHFTALANRRVALGLLLNRIIEVNQVKLDYGRVRAAIDDLALSYEDPQEVVNWYYSNKDQLSQVQNMVVEDQVVDLILEKAKVTERKIGFKELMQQPTNAGRA
jgi:trigger factor